MPALLLLLLRELVGTKRLMESVEHVRSVVARPNPAPGLEAEAATWLRRKENSNTRDTYDSAVRQYSAWLTGRGLTLESTSAPVLVLYVKHLLEGKAEPAAANTIQGAISAIRNHFRYDPGKTSMFESAMVRDAIKIGKRDGRTAVKKRPLTVRMLQAMVDWHHAKGGRPEAVGWTDTRDIALILIMTACFLRESEAVMLKPEHVRIHKLTVNGVEREVLEVYVARAKNDQAGQGHLIRVGDAPGSDLCPVFWSRLIAARRRPNARPVSFFTTYDGGSLAKTTPCGIVQKWVERINAKHRNEFGSPKSYGSHSCRSGGVTAAHGAGVDMTLIAQHGNWKSDVVYDYIQPSVHQQVEVTSFMQASSSSAVAAAAAAAAASQVK